MAKSQSFGHLLNNTNTGLAKVVSRAKKLKKLTTLLKSMVDAPLSDHIYVANIRDTTLIIGTDSAAWHTRVKYLAPMILDQMRQLPDMDRLPQIAPESSRPGERPRWTPCWLSGPNELTPLAAMTIIVGAHVRTPWTIALNI